jgi:hypothetical protein
MTMHPTGDRNPVLVFFGWLLIAVGGLITFASGACTVTFVIGGFSQTNADGFIEWLLLCLAIGAAPMIFGAGLVVVGWLMCRRRVTRRDRPPPH